MIMPFSPGADLVKIIYAIACADFVLETADLNWCCGGVEPARRHHRSERRAWKRHKRELGRLIHDDGATAQ